MGCGAVDWVQDNVIDPVKDVFHDIDENLLEPIYNPVKELIDPLLPEWVKEIDDTVKDRLLDPQHLLRHPAELWKVPRDIAEQALDPLLPEKAKDLMHKPFRTLEKIFVPENEMAQKVIQGIMGVVGVILAPMTAGASLWISKLAAAGFGALSASKDIPEGASFGESILPVGFGGVSGYAMAQLGAGITNGINAAANGSNFVKGFTSGYQDYAALNAGKEGVVTAITPELTQGLSQIDTALQPVYNAGGVNAAGDFLVNGAPISSFNAGASMDAGSLTKYLDGLLDGTLKMSGEAVTKGAPDMLGTLYNSLGDISKTVSGLTQGYSMTTGEPLPDWLNYVNMAGTLKPTIDKLKTSGENIYSFFSPEQAGEFAKTQIGGDPVAIFGEGGLFDSFGNIVGTGGKIINQLGYSNPDWVNYANLAGQIGGMVPPTWGSPNTGVLTPEQKLIQQQYSTSKYDPITGKLNPNYVEDFGPGKTGVRPVSDLWLDQSSVGKTYDELYPNYWAQQNNQQSIFDTLLNDPFALSTDDKGWWGTITDTIDKASDFLGGEQVQKVTDAIGNIMGGSGKQQQQPYPTTGAPSYGAPYYGAPAYGAPTYAPTYSPAAPNAPSYAYDPRINIQNTNIQNPINYEDIIANLFPSPGANLAGGPMETYTGGNSVLGNLMSILTKGDPGGGPGGPGIAPYKDEEGKDIGNMPSAITSLINLIPGLNNQGGLGGFIQSITGNKDLQNILGTAGDIWGGIEAGKQAEQQRDWYTELYAPQKAISQTQAELMGSVYKPYQEDQYAAYKAYTEPQIASQYGMYKDVFEPATRQLGGELTADLGKEFSLTKQLESDIWRQKKERLGGEREKLQQGATERFAGAGMIGQGPAQQYFQNLDEQYLKSFEDLAVEQSIWEYGQKYQEKQDRYGNMMSFLNKTPGTYAPAIGIPSASSTQGMVNPTQQIDWSKILADFGNDGGLFG